MSRSSRQKRAAKRAQRLKINPPPPKPLSPISEPEDDGHHLRQDMRLTEMAIRRGWDIPARVMNAWPAEIIKIVADKAVGIRDRLRAMELMAKMHGQNQADAPATQKFEHTINPLPAATSRLLENEDVRNALLRAEEEREATEYPAISASEPAGA